MKEKTKDIIAGIFSVILIVSIFYLYFNNLLHVNPIFVESDMITYNQTVHNSCHITVTNPTVILRLDDVGYFNKETESLVNEVLKRNISITLGVIPVTLKNNEYLLKIRNNPLIEIAQHGTFHNETDKYMTESNLLFGRTEIARDLGIVSVTYIPPYNDMTDKAKETVSRYFNTISGEQGMLKEGEKIAEIGYTVETYQYDLNQDVPVDVVIDKCRASLEKTNLCVIMLHPQEYGKTLTSSEFIWMLDNLQKLNVTFERFNEIVTCT